ncbi:MAG TPA: SGNH/GDSL hydrolase family protein [Thermoanaerobaculia bacterium]|nr:SGNH/GDSL hydrolase family protein [Thermoanaerobaculia bacterium]
MSLAAWKPRLRRLALAALLAGLGGELGLRLVDAATGHRTGSLYQYVVFSTSRSGVLRYKMAPGARFFVPERYGDIEYRFNALGYRDRDHDPASSRPRLVILGDSVSFGLGAPQETIYARRLDEALGPRGWEVVNLAIFGYNSRDALEALRDDGLPMAPAVVLHQFYMNDLATPAEAPTPPTPTLRQRLTAVKNRVTFASNLYRRAYQVATGLAYHFGHDLKRLKVPERLNRAEVTHKSEYLAAHPEDADVPAFVALAEIFRLTREAGAQPVLMVSPDEVQLIERQWDGINERLHRFAAAHGVPVIDLLPLLRGRPEWYRLFLDGVHLSPRAHGLVTEHLAAELARLGLLAPRSQDP